MEKKFDLILCVGPQHIEIAKIALRHIALYFRPESIFLITKKDFFQNFDDPNNTPPNIRLVDENTIFQNFSYASVCEFLMRKTQNTERAGWYFQQFLKMEAHKLVNESFYLIWDADTIPLRQFGFFDDQSTVRIQPGQEHHLPYFDTMKSLLHIERQVDFSFISEHMMVSREQMKTLVRELADKDKSVPWPTVVLNNIATDQLILSGFSEYETFGNYVWKLFPSTIRLREYTWESIKTFRFGAKLFGSLPSKNDLHLLKEIGYHYVTFETWNEGETTYVKRNKQLAKRYQQLPKFWPFDIIRNRIVKNIRKQM